MKLYKNKIAVVSDIHAGVHQNSQAWYNVLHTWADWFKQQCIDNNIKDIIIPGDVFHHRNEINVHTNHTVYNVFKKFQDFNIIILIGNHDAYYKDNSNVHSLSFLNEWENITIVDSVTMFQAFGKQITICPWGTDIKDIPECDIIFGHFELQGFKYAKNKICAHGISSENILSKAPLVITGHFHLRDERKYKDGTILYVGCAYEQNWGDSETSKGYYILDIETSTFEFVENTVTPKHKKILLTDILKTGITSTIKDSFYGNWVKIIIDKKISADSIDQLITKLTTLQPLSLHIEYTYADIGNDIIEYDFAGVDINECIQEYVALLDIDYKQEVISYILDLYKRVS